SAISRAAGREFLMLLVCEVEDVDCPFGIDNSGSEDSDPVQEVGEIGRAEEPQSRSRGPSRAITIPIDGKVETTAVDLGIEANHIEEGSVARQTGLESRIACPVPDQIRLAQHLDTSRVGPHRSTDKS